MFANLHLKLSRYGMVSVVIIASIDFSQEIFAMDMLTAL